MMLFVAGLWVGFLLCAELYAWVERRARRKERQRDDLFVQRVMDDVYRAHAQERADRLQAIDRLITETGGQP